MPFILRPYHPSKKQVREALEVALPAALTNGKNHASLPEDAIKSLESMNAKNWRQKRDEALSLLRQNIAS